MLGIQCLQKVSFKIVLNYVDIRLNFILTEAFTVKKKKKK